MSLPNSLLQLWAARIASKIAICSAMTYDLYQLSKTRGKDGTLKLGISDEKRRQLAKKKKTSSDKRTVEDVFIESLVAASSCRHHAPRRQTSTPLCSSNSARRTRHPPRIPCISMRRFTTERSKRQTAALSVPDETT